MPPKRLQVGEVVKYVKEKHGLEVTRQTVYNWMKLGRRSESLQYVTAKAKLGLPYTMVTITNTEWVDAFLHRANIVRSA